MAGEGEKSSERRRADGDETGRKSGHARRGLLVGGRKERLRGGGDGEDERGSNERRKERVAGRR